LLAKASDSLKPRVERGFASATQDRDLETVETLTP